MDMFADSITPTMFGEDVTETSLLEKMLELKKKSSGNTNVTLHQQHEFSNIPFWELLDHSEIIDLTAVDSEPRPSGAEQITPISEMFEAHSITQEPNNPVLCDMDELVELFKNLQISSSEPSAEEATFPAGTPTGLLSNDSAQAEIGGAGFLNTLLPPDSQNASPWVNWNLNA